MYAYYVRDNCKERLPTPTVSKVQFKWGSFHVPNLIPI